MRHRGLLPDKILPELNNVRKGLLENDKSQKLPQNILFCCRLNRLRLIVLNNIESTVNISKMSCLIRFTPKYVILTLSHLLPFEDILNFKFAVIDRHIDCLIKLNIVSK